MLYIFVKGLLLVMFRHNFFFFENNFKAKLPPIT